jgi:small redox-active disulfide protein 2
LKEENNMKIEILGSGCSKCRKLAKNTEKAVNDLGVDAEITKVEDMTEIMERGVMLTPALSVNGKVVSSGKVLSPEKIAKHLK